MGWRQDIEGASTAKLTHSTNDGVVVLQSPAELLRAAQAKDASISEDEYTLARIVASEYSSGNATALAALADADATKARGKGISVYQHATGGTGRYGKQGGARPVSTRLDPSFRHLAAARAALRTWGGARGIARGAVRYLDVWSQLAALKDPRRKDTHCHPLVVLERWTYDKAWAYSSAQRAADPAKRCALSSRHGRDQQEWVGPIEGIDPMKLLLFRPAGEQQAQRYDEAVRIIESRGDWQPPTTSPPPGKALGKVITAAVALWLWGG